MIVTATLILMCASILIAIIHKNNTDNTPITKELMSQVDFNIYYPKSLPEGYSLDRKSVKLEKNVVFVSFTKGSGTIVMSQTKMPDYDPGLNWVGLEELKISIGTAYTGRNSGRAVALISTKDTLINIAATPDVPDQAVSGLAYSLRKL